MKNIMTGLVGRAGGGVGLGLRLEEDDGIEKKMYEEKKSIEI